MSTESFHPPKNLSDKLSDKFLGDDKAIYKHIFFA
jgi:hypothetical protein